jgi:hypothetical protein
MKEYGMKWRRSSGKKYIGRLAFKLFHIKVEMYRKRAATSCIC